MNKKGVIAETVVATIVIALVLIGTVSFVDEASKVFVGDKLTNNYYEYPLCLQEIKKINQSQFIYFDVEQKARDAGYVRSEVCK